MTTVYSLRFATPPTWRARFPYLYYPVTGWPSYTPRNWNPFPSPFRTRRDTVEVIRSLLHTLEGQSAIPWRINSRRAEYKTPPPTVPPLFAFVFVAGQAWTGRVESHVTTGGQSASPPRNKAPIWGSRPDFHHCQRLTGTLIRPPPPRTWGRVRRPKPLPALACAVNLGSESRGTRDHTPPSQIRDFPFRRFPGPAGPRWRHSTPIPHGISNIQYFFIGPARDIIICVSLFVFDHKLSCLSLSLLLRLTVSQPVCLWIKHTSGA
jgi:hypothetical protein